MASKRNPSDPSGPAARQPKRSQTIELDANEVSSDSDASSSAVKDAAEDSTSKKGTAWLPARGAGVIITSGIIGAAGALFIFGVLSFAGYFAGGNGYEQRLSDIEARLSERAVRPAPARGDSKALEDLAARVDKLEKTAATATSPLSDPALANRLTSAENATKTFADDIGALNRRVDDLSAAVRELRNRMDSSPPVDKTEIEAIANRIAALEKSAGTMETELGKRATIASDRAVRLALATSALRAAVERGDPFVGELAAARPLAPENTFSALEPFAATGVPSNVALAGELATLVPTLRAAANAVPSDAGFFDRLKSNASRLVRIRPADESASDDPAAVINRIEQKAANADIAGALADLAKLPDPVRAPAQAWIGKAQARIAAVQTSRQLAADAIGALGKLAP